MHGLQVCPQQTRAERVPTQTTAYLLPVEGAVVVRVQPGEQDVHRHCTAALS